MEPSFYDSDKVQVVYQQTPKRFDVVVIDFAEKGLYLKRVIGLPGETILYKNHQLYVDGKKIADIFADKTKDFDLQKSFGLEKISKNEYFVLGDNREVSKDSRYFGLVSADKIVGIVSEGADH